MFRPLLCLVLFAVAVSQCGCSGSLFKVKPVNQLPPLPNDARISDGEGISVKLSHILEDEESQELFEANLPLSGIAAVRTELSFRNGPTVELKKLRFRLRDDQGREWKLLSSKQTVSRVLKAANVSAYNPISKKQFIQELDAYSLDLQKQLSQSEPRQTGFLFFQSPNKRPLDNTQRFTLAIERLPQPMTIPLN